MKSSNVDRESLASETTRASEDSLLAADLFCGAGGLSLGIQEAGFRIAVSIDHDDAAIETYKRNIGDHARLEEITDGVQIPEVDLITGGPPCQGFSSAGPRRVGDHRNSLVGVFAEVVIRRLPRAFVFENVEGFLTAEGGRRVIELLDPLVRAGYRIHLRKINAANYGVPQHRKRVLAVGGLGWDPSFPMATHAAFGAPGAARCSKLHLPRARTLQDALRELPPATVDRESSVISDHYYHPLDLADLTRVNALEQGQTMRDLPEELWHESYKRRAFRRVMDGTPTDRRGGAPAGVRRLRFDQPSKAITGGARSEFVHPVENRYLTLRECARIQTFPDSFEFLGSAPERALQIGNAVPPMLGFVIGTSLMKDFRRTPIRQHEQGALLSFVPTVSEGMSPALQLLVDAVAKRFGHCVDEIEQMALWR